MKQNITLCILISLLIAIGGTLVNAQEEKKEQLWYCWEEEVIPEKRAEYLKLIKELNELGKQEKLPFSVFTWTPRPLVYQYWTPIGSLNDIEEINNAWNKVIQKWGDEKYAAYNNTRTHFLTKTCTVLDYLQYTPKNPYYDRMDGSYTHMIEMHLKFGKQAEMEDIIQWLNKRWEEADYGAYAAYAIGEMGFEEPCFILMFSGLNQLEYIKASEQMRIALGDDWTEFLDKIRLLQRKPTNFVDWYYLKELSYEPEGE